MTAKDGGSPGKVGTWSPQEAVQRDLEGGAPEFAEEPGSGKSREVHQTYLRTLKGWSQRAGTTSLGLGRSIWKEPTLGVEYQGNLWLS